MKLGRKRGSGLEGVPGKATGLSLVGWEGWSAFEGAKPRDQVST